MSEIPKLEVGDVVQATDFSCAYVSGGGDVCIESHGNRYGRSLVVRDVTDDNGVVFYKAHSGIRLVALRALKPKIRAIHRAGVQIYPKPEPSIEEVVLAGLEDIIRGYHTNSGNSDFTEHLATQVCKHFDITPKGGSA